MGKKLIIDDISFSVRAGEVFTLIGPNGAGKSTILKTITRQLKKLHGDICVFDEEISRLSDAGLSKPGINGHDISNKERAYDLQGYRGNRQVSIYREVWSTF